MSESSLDKEFSLNVNGITCIFRGNYDTENRRSIGCGEIVRFSDNKLIARRVQGSGNQRHKILINVHGVTLQSLEDAIDMLNVFEHLKTTYNGIR